MQHSTLMDTNLAIEIVTELIIQTHTEFSILISYIALTAHITHSSTPTLLIVHQRTFLGTWS